MINFSQNINPLGPPRFIKDFLKQNPYIVSKYPSKEPAFILEELANFFSVTPQNVTFGNGSTELFFMLPRMLSYSRAVIPVPTFWEYNEFNKQYKKEIKKVFLKEKDDFNIDYVALNKIIQKKDAVFLCNPNNPTSQLLNKKEIINLVKNNPLTHFIIDETYLLFRKDYLEQTCNTEVNKYSNLYIVTSLSKFFSIPGLRCGVLITNKKSAKYYKSQFFIPYSINNIVEEVLPKILTDNEFITKSREYMARELLYMYNSFSKKLKGRLKIIKPETNFLLGRILTGQRALDISKCLKNKGIYVRTGDELHDLGRYWLRINVQTSKNNKILLQELDECLK